MRLAAGPSADPGPTRQAVEIAMSSEKWAELWQENSTTTCDLILSKLQVGGYLTPTGEVLTPKEVIPKIYADRSSDFSDYALSPSSRFAAYSVYL